VGFMLNKVWIDGIYTELCLFVSQIGLVDGGLLTASLERENVEILGWNCSFTCCETILGPTF